MKIRPRLFPHVPETKKSPNPDSIPDPDALPVSRILADLQHIPGRGAGRVPRARLRKAGIRFEDIGNPHVLAHENHIQWNERVLHPELVRLRGIEHEPHAFVLAKGRAEHQPFSTLSRRVRNLGSEKGIRTYLKGDCRFFGGFRASQEQRQEQQDHQQFHAYRLNQPVP